MEPLHRLWLGYISELLGLPLRDATNANQVVGNTSTTATPSETQSIPHTETQHVRTVQALEDGISLTKMQGWQAKLVKADFHGCKIEGREDTPRWYTECSPVSDSALQLNERNILP
jgi:hypothetical protein